MLPLRSEIEKRRKAFLCKWRLKCRAVADSLEEAGDRLLAFHSARTRCSEKCARTTTPSNGSTMFPPPDQDADAAAVRETVPMWLWPLMASGQYPDPRKLDGWETLSQPVGPINLYLAA